MCGGACCSNCSCCSSSCSCRSCCRPPASGVKTRDFINVYHEETMRMHWFYQILRSTPRMPDRPHPPLELPLPIKQRQPSKRRKIPPYKFLTYGQEKISAEAKPKIMDPGLKTDRYNWCVPKPKTA